jgi:hypothetical protein
MTTKQLCTKSAQDKIENVISKKTAAYLSCYDIIKIYEEWNRKF